MTIKTFAEEMPDLTRGYYSITTNRHTGGIEARWVSPELALRYWALYGDPPGTCRWSHEAPADAELVVGPVTLDHEAEFAAHASRIARQDIAEGRPGYHRNLSNSPAWRDGYDAGRIAAESS